MAIMENIERLEITDSISGTDWPGVDKDRIWEIIDAALDAGIGGAVQATREMYAVLREQPDDGLQKDEVWGAHHEISSEGTLSLNRGGLLDVAGAFEAQNLTSTEREDVRQHLIRHFEEVEELQIPENLEGEMDTIPIQFDTKRMVQPPKGELAVEVALEHVPLSEEQRQAAGKLMDGDDDPCWVAQEISEGKGNWGYYKQSAINAIVQQVNQRQPSGYLGHQKPGDIPYQFPDPVTHWFAAEMNKTGDKASAKVYGLIDKKAADLKRWIRSRRINEVSIFGYPQYKPGTKDIIGYKLRSIDWTPRDGAGLGSKLLWATGGEMDKGTYNITVDENGEIVNVNPFEKENEKMSYKEQMAEIRSGIAKGELAVADVISELGVTGEQAVPELADLKGARESHDALVEALGCGEMEAGAVTERAKAMKETFDKLAVAGREDVAVFAGELLDTHRKTLEAEKEKALTEAIEEKVKGEQARLLVRRLMGEADAAKTKEEYCGEVDALLEDGEIKGMLSRLAVDGPTYDGASGGEQKTGFISGKTRKERV